MATAARNHFRVTVSSLQMLLRCAPRVRHSYGTSYYSCGINAATIITRYIIRSSRSPGIIIPAPRRDLRNSDSFYRSRCPVHCFYSRRNSTFSCPHNSHVYVARINVWKFHIYAVVRNTGSHRSRVGRHWDVYLRAAFCIGNGTCMRTCTHVGYAIV